MYNPVLSYAKVGMGISSLDATSSAVRLGVFLHRWHIRSTFFILLFQAWAWTGSSFHPFLKRRNSSDEGVTTDFNTNVPHHSSSAHDKLIVFGQNWATAFANDNIGCQSGRGSFMWRGQGFGSNINSECGYRPSHILLCCFSFFCKIIL